MRLSALREEESATVAGKLRNRMTEVERSASERSELQQTDSVLDEAFCRPRKATADSEVLGCSATAAIRVEAAVPVGSSSAQRTVVGCRSVVATEAASGRPDFRSGRSYWTEPCTTWFVGGFPLDCRFRSRRATLQEVNEESVTIEIAVKTAGIIFPSGAIYVG